MQYMSDEYHASMAQPIRNRSHIRAEIYQDGGDTISFSEDQIVNFSRHDFCSPISESLPTSDMTLVIDNRDMTYDPDNENSPITLLQRGLRMMVQMGYEIDGDGTITWIPAFYGYLSDWDASDTEAIFTAQDRVSQMSAEYAGGVQGNSVTNYFSSVAEDVFDTAGMTSTEYQLNINSATTKNAVPVVPCSEALQLVANASGAAFYEHRNGNIVLESENPSVSNIYANEESAYSDTSSVIGSTDNAYGLQAYNYTIVGKSLIAPADTSEKLDGTGFTSNVVADSTGAFSTNPQLTLLLSNTATFSQVAIKFQGSLPTEFELVGVNYLLGTIIVDETVTNVSEYTVVSADFTNVNQLTFIFKSAEEGAAVCVTSISFSPVYDYVITRQMMTASPKAKRPERVKQITVNKHSWKRASARSDVYSESFTLASGETREVTVTWTEPCDASSSSVYSVTSDNSNITVSNITRNSRSATFTLTASAAGTATITVNAYEMIDTVSVGEQESYNTNGLDVAWDNPLCDGDTAADMLEVLSDYYLGKVDYEINWRGDPCVDVNDKLYLELKDGSTVPIRIYENTLQYNGVLSGIIRARRVEL